MTFTLHALSVDDTDINLEIIEACAAELKLMDIVDLLELDERQKKEIEEVTLEVHSFTDSREALAFSRDNDFDIVFLDYIMPGMNGLDFLRIFRAEVSAFTPVIMITADDDTKVRYTALETGATDFLTKPFDPNEFTARTKNLLKLKVIQNQLANRAEWLAGKVREATREIQEREHEALILLGRASEMRDSDTGAHINRVAFFSQELAIGIGLSDDDVDLILYGSPLHDVGKVGISDSILLKAGRLTEEETAVMRTHTILGDKILQNAKSKYMQIGRRIALTHHEDFNGEGYPYGIAGEDIPIEGRITMIADVFDALCSRRPYKEPWSMDRIIEFMVEQKGKKFDPDLVDIFLTKAESFYNYVLETNELLHLY